MPPSAARALFAVALALFCIGEARGQASLRGDEFPTSPTIDGSSPFLTPENNSLPAIDASPAAADERSPPRRQPNPPDPNAPNYGKRRLLKPKLYAPRLKSAPPLSPLVPYRGAPGPQRHLLNPLPTPATVVDGLPPAPNIAVVPSPARLRRALVEADPFLPSGVRVGQFNVLPFVELSTGYESNPNQVSLGVKPSAVLRAAAGADVASDFSTHSLTASLRGGYSDFPANNNANRPDASGVVDGRFDVTRDDQILTEGRFSVATQTPGSPLLAVPNSVFIVTRPTIVTEGVTLGGAHRFNRLLLDLRGVFDRVQYGDAVQSDGSIFRYSQDNYNDLGIVGRASYELTPQIIPFVEAGFDARVRDDPVDLSGYLRDSTGVVARAGSTFEFARLLTGTASVGYADRHYADSRLPNLQGPTVNGALVYAFTPLTTITARASTTLSETTLAGASGAISRLVSVEIGHVFARQFAVSAVAAYQNNQYQGVVVNENFTQFTLKAAYSFTRDVQLVSSVSQQRLSSTLQGNSYRDTIFLTGVRLQR